MTHVLKAARAIAMLPAALVAGTVLAWGSAAAQTPVPLDASADTNRVGAASYVQRFGPYQPLPDWSGWCGGKPEADFDRCVKSIKDAVAARNMNSRPTVRAHGWSLWAGIWAPLPVTTGIINDPAHQVTNFDGTTGCWTKNPLNGPDPVCSGIYPIWMSWPNTGSIIDLSASRAEDKGGDSPVPYNAKPLRLRNSTPVSHLSSDPDPTQTQTVDPDPRIQYRLSARVLSKNCKLSDYQAGVLLEKKQINEIQKACIAATNSKIYCGDENSISICDGTAFVNEGDVMIATESISEPAYNRIVDKKLNNLETLASLYNAKSGGIDRYITKDFVSTKHMFWPVKGCRPGAVVGSYGCRVRYGALPPWIPANFKTVNYATDAEYRGYEKWGSVVAIDTCDNTTAVKECPGPASSATLQLAMVDGVSPITTHNPKVYPASAFRHIQVSQELMIARLTPTDRALLDQSTIWAYGEASNGFEAGDFLVVVAMHVNTKELESWALQSVWWSPMDDRLADCPVEQYNHCFGQAETYGATTPPRGDAPNPTSGLSKAALDALDRNVQNKNWRMNYLMTDSYGLNFQIDGKPSELSDYFAPARAPEWAKKNPSGGDLAYFPVSQNVYIEPVIHPLGTECRNCHYRAGYVPGSPPDDAKYPVGSGRTGYQTAQCPSLLGDYGAPASNVCMTNPWIKHTGKENDCKEEAGGVRCDGKNAYPVLQGDLIWFIPDGHIQN